MIIFILNIITVRGKINSIYETFIYNKSVMVQHSAIYYYHYEDFKDFIINLETREVISVTGQEYEGRIYYRVKDI